MHGVVGRVKQVFIGHLTLDDVVLPDGSTQFDSLGGAALYAAAGSQLWNGQSGIVSRVGHDYSKERLNDFRKAGLDITGIIPYEGPNIHIWALYDRLGYRYFIPQIGGGSYDEMAPLPVEIPEVFLAEASAFHIAPMPLACQEKLVERLSLLDKCITLDPHHEWLEATYRERWKKILSRIEVFLPSEDEMTVFWGIEKQADLENYKPYLKKLAEIGPSAVVLKLGARGVMLYEETADRFYTLPSIAEKVIDVTGAGDAFCGGFLAGLAETENVLLAAMYGTVSSSVLVEHFGAEAAFRYDRNIIQSRLQTLIEGYQEGQR